MGFVLDAVAAHLEVGVVPGFDVVGIHESIGAEDEVLLGGEHGAVGLDAVLVAVELVIESGALSAEHVLNVLARLNAVPTPESVETTLQLKEAPLANTSRYDSLRSAMDLACNAVEVNHAQ